MTPEGAVKQRIKALLKQHNAWYFMPAMGSFGKSGVPDIVGCHNGRFFAIEAKAGKGKCTALQEKQIAAIQAAGGFAVVINETEGWEFLHAFLHG